MVSKRQGGGGEEEEEEEEEDRLTRRRTKVKESFVRVSFVESARPQANKLGG